jgi:SAM-dependent methyltransferase/uncharacterized protein YbaR (Trm112 family)
MTFQNDQSALRMSVPLLRCPQTRLPLRLLSLAEARIAMGSQELVPRTNRAPAPFGVTDTLLVRSDNLCAYPVVNGVPILMAPEQLTSPAHAVAFNLRDPRYAEAYEEMEHYNKVAEAQASSIRDAWAFRAVEPALRLPASDRRQFPDPRAAWIDSVPDCKAQFEAYQYLGDLGGKRFFQLGGSGIHAVKALLAGAEEAWVLTPMLGEAYCSIALAREAGVAGGLRCIVAVAEEIPVADSTFDAVYSGGCVHHMTTDIALPEVARVIKTGGRFSCSDPWRAPLYAVGTRIFGKREANVFCRPLTPARVAPLFKAFPNAKLAQYGTLTRYPVLALSRFGVNVGPRAMWFLYGVDDGLCSLLPGFRRMGSSVALFGTK